MCMPYDIRCSVSNAKMVISASDIRDMTIEKMTVILFASSVALHALVICHISSGLFLPDQQILMFTLCPYRL